MKTPVLVVLIIVSIGFWIGTACAAMQLRGEKGHDSQWLACLLLGVLALIYAAGLPDLILRKSLEQQKEATSRSMRSVLKQKTDEKEPSNSEDMHQAKRLATHKWICPKCGQFISEDECPFCGHRTK